MSINITNNRFRFNFQEHKTLNQIKTRDLTTKLNTNNIIQQNGLDPTNAKTNLTNQTIHDYSPDEKRS